VILHKGYIEMLKYCEIQANYIEMLKYCEIQANYIEMLKYCENAIIHKGLHINSVKIR